MRTRKSGLRTSDVARRAGCSAQQLRDLEHEGVLPPAARTPSGYRTYAEIHVSAAVAYRHFAVAAGPTEARRLMRAANRGTEAELLSRVDAVHADLHAERRALRVAVRAAEAIADEPVEPALPTDAMRVSELAGALGVRPSTLRHWDAEGLVVPTRRAPRRERSYTPADVRDARVVYQLRKAGYRVEALRTLLPELRRARRSGELAAALATREADVDRRSRALVDATAALRQLLDSSASARR